MLFSITELFHRRQDRHALTSRRSRFLTSAMFEFLLLLLHRPRLRANEKRVAPPLVAYTNIEKNDEVEVSYISLSLSRASTAALQRFPHLQVGVPNDSLRNDGTGRSCRPIFKGSIQLLTQTLDSIQSS